MKYNYMYHKRGNSTLMEEDQGPQDTHEYTGRGNNYEDRVAVNSKGGVMEIPLDYDDVRLQSSIKMRMIQTGYKTLASYIGNPFIIKWTRHDAAFMYPGTGVLYINGAGIPSLDARVTLAKHEMLHELLDHQVKCFKAFCDIKNLPFEDLCKNTTLKDLTMQEFYSYIIPEKYRNLPGFQVIAGNRLDNGVGDEDLSHFYSQKDKEIIKDLAVNGERTQGVLIDDFKGSEFSNWMNLSLEDLYKELFNYAEKEEGGGTPPPLPPQDPPRIIEGTLGEDGEFYPEGEDFPFDPYSDM